MDDFTFGQWLQRRRRALLLTQSALADQAACSTAAIRKIEADERRPSPAIAEHLARALGVPETQRAAFVRFARGEAGTFQQPGIAQEPVPAPWRARSVPPYNLPSAPTPLIGRTQEVVAVATFLRQSDRRLVTLTGPGGIGKTRLSLSVAAALRETFPDGVFFVALGPLRDHALVLPAIARTLEVSGEASQPLVASLRRYLRQKQLLLVLDNCEHLLPALPIVSELLASAPHLHVLATSREALHLANEQEVAVPPLALPDRQRFPEFDALSRYDAVQLFIQRAQAVKHTFVVTPATAPVVAAICHRLDGLPLAIELAAARIKLLAPHALLQRLDNRLGLLTGGGRDLPARQQTLRATIEWSYNLLAEDEQRLFRRLAVLVGGHTFEAAEHVCRLPGDGPLDMLDGHQSLIDKSLLQQADGVLDEPRFSMLETIRAYALEQIDAQGERELLQQQHAAYYLALVEAAEPFLRHTEQLSWLDRLAAEHDNVRAALAWSLSPRGDSAVGLRLAGALGWFWLVRVHEGRAWLEALLRRVELAPDAPIPAATRVKALMATGLLAQHQNDFACARQLHSTSLALARAVGDRAAITWSLAYLGWVLYHQQDYGAAQDALDESVRLARASEEPQAVGFVLRLLGSLAQRQGDLARAAQLYQESLGYLRQQGDRWSIAVALGDLAGAQADQANQAEVVALLEESLALFRDVGDRHGSVNILLELGRLTFKHGEYGRAGAYYRESMILVQQWDIDNRRSLAAALIGLAAVARVTGQPGRAACLLGAIDRMLDATPTPAQGQEAAMREHTTTVIRSALGADAFVQAWDEGRSMPLEVAVAYALEDDTADGTA